MNSNPIDPPASPDGAASTTPDSSTKPLQSIVIRPGDVTPFYLRPGLDPIETRWTSSPVMTLAVLFLVTGAFGIPLLWRNPRFSTWQSCLWSVLVTVYTLALFAGVVWIVRSSLANPQGG